MGLRRKPVLAGINHRFLSKAFALLFRRAWLSFFSPYLKLSGSGSIARVKEAQSLFAKGVVCGALLHFSSQYFILSSLSFRMLIPASKKAASTESHATALNTFRYGIPSLLSSGRLDAPRSKLTTM